MMIGKLNIIIGLIKFDKPKPELNHITISLSLYQRVKVIKTVKKSDNESNNGKCLSKLKTRIVSIASLGIIPFAAKRKI
jgi:hypothetical protein